jgi:type IV fimbrial biogenesis protein FimT
MIDRLPRSRRGRCAFRAQRPRRHEFGVTLIELMFAIAILAILVTVAVPSFRDASLTSRLSSISNDLLASIQVARSESIKSNSVTTLCTSDDGTTCAGSGDWEQGWIILDKDGVVIQSHAALPNGYKVAEASATEVLLFEPIGVGATAASFTVCRDDPVGNQERIVTVTATGMASVTRTTDGACP